MYICLNVFVIGFYFFLCPCGIPWANYSAAFPKKVQQWQDQCVCNEMFEVFVREDYL